MKPDYEKRIAVRISTEDSQCLDRLVQEGKFKNRSSAIRQALDVILSVEPNQVAEAVVLSKGEIKASNTGEEPCKTASI